MLHYALMGSCKEDAFFFNTVRPHIGLLAPKLCRNCVSVCCVQVYAHQKHIPHVGDRASNRCADHVAENSCFISAEAALFLHSLTICNYHNNNFTTINDRFCLLYDIILCFEMNRRQQAHLWVSSGGVRNQSSQRIMSKKK